MFMTILCVLNEKEVWVISLQWRIQGGFGGFDRTPFLAGYVIINPLRMRKRVTVVCLSVCVSVTTLVAL